MIIYINTVVVSYEGLDWNAWQRGGNQYNIHGHHEGVQ